MALQEDLIKALWGSQEFFASTVDALWQQQMAAATAKLGRARGNFKDAIRGAQRTALAFGKRKDLFDVTEQAIAEAYIIGKLFISERDKQIRERGKATKPPKTFRVDKASDDPKKIRAARRRIQTLVEAGKLKPVGECKCVDCGGVAKQYDHHKGYDHPEAVQPVCASCHKLRTDKRLKTQKAIHVEKAKPSKSPAASITAATSLTLADEAAIQKLSGQTTLWFRNVKGTPFSGTAATDAIQETAAKLIAQGKSASEIAPILQAKAEALYGVGEFAGRGRTYWGGVAEHAATSAGVAGQLTQLVDLGWNRYEIVNPMDQRTTPICQHLNGKTVVVSAGVAEVAAVSEATTPEEVKAAKPFVSGGSVKDVNKALGSELKIGAGDLSGAQSDALSAAGFATPPYHFRCRSYIDISFSEGDTVPALGPSFVPPSALKKPPTTPGAAAVPPPKPKPLPEAPKPVVPVVEPPPPPPAPKPVPAAAPPPPPPPELPPGGFPFYLDDVKVIDTKLGGANPKFVIEAADGSRWMFKDYEALGSPFRAHVDALAARVQIAAGVETPQTFVIDLPKNWKGWGAGERPRNTSGSLQRLFDSDTIAAKDLNGLSLGDLGPLARVDLQVDHAVNWLISNGDGHYENFLLLKNGRVAGIDKAQGFKFFGKDRLAIDYVSPQAPFPSSNGFAYMENQLQRYAQNASLEELQGVRSASGGLTKFGQRLQAIVDIPDDEYAAIIRPYLEGTKSARAGMFGYDGAYAGKSVDDALAAILKRKNGLVDDMDDLYKGIEKTLAKARGVKIPPATAKVPPALDVPKPSSGPLDFHAPGRSGLASQIEKSKLRGFYVMSGGFDLESSGMMGRRLIRKGGTGTKAAQYQFKGKLNKSAIDRLKALAEKELTGGTSTVGLSDELVAARSRMVAVENSATSFGRSYNARLDPAGGHDLFGSDIQLLAGRFNSQMEKLDTIIVAGSDGIGWQAAGEKSLALGKLSFVPTELDVAYAKHFRRELEKYLVDPKATRAARVFKTDRWASKGHTIKEFDEKSFKATQKPGLAKPIEPDAKAFTVRRGGKDNLFMENVWVSPEGAVIQEEWGTAAARANYEAIGFKEADVASAFNGQKTPFYIFESVENKNISVRFISDKPNNEFAKQFAFRGEIRLVIDKANPTAKDMRDGFEFMRKLGLDVKDAAPTIDEAKVIWARKQADAIGLGYDRRWKQLFDDVPTSLPAKEQLKQLASAFDKVADDLGRGRGTHDRLRWNELTKGMKDKDFLPVFTQDSTTAGRKAQAHGFPQWVRRDITEAGLKKEGIYGSFSASSDSAPQLAKIMTGGDNVSMVATTTRMDQGIYGLSGMSPVDDMGTGGADYVFTRIRAGKYNYGTLDTDELGARIARSRKGTAGKKFDPAKDYVSSDKGLYFNRKSMTYTDNLHYSGDVYGEVSTPEFISRNMAQTISGNKPEGIIKSHMTAAGNNEMIVKNSLGMQDHLEFWVVDDFSERSAAIQAFKDAGITKFGKKNVEDVFVVRTRGGGFINAKLTP